MAEDKKIRAILELVAGRKFDDALAKIAEYANTSGVRLSKKRELSGIASIVKTMQNLS